jgi:hypothetical protein
MPPQSPLAKSGTQSSGRRFAAGSGDCPDVFGQEIASAEVAWEFINELYGSTEIERPAALPPVFTRQFKHDYRGHCTILLANASPVA